MFLQNNTTTQRDVECFTILGQQDYLDSDNRPKLKDETKCLAKSVTIDNRPTKYYIRVGTYGKVYNPIGLYSEGHSEKFLSKMGKKQFEFKEVNKTIFDYYIKFLTTKNIAWLNHAEREMI